MTALMDLKRSWSFFMRLYFVLVFFILLHSINNRDNKY